MPSRNSVCPVLRLYASGNNLFQIVSKDFLGYDPESTSETSSTDKGAGKFGQNMTFFSIREHVRLLSVLM